MCCKIKNPTKEKGFLLMLVLSQHIYAATINTKQRQQLIVKYVQRFAAHIRASLRDGVCWLPCCVGFPVQSVVDADTQMFVFIDRLHMLTVDVTRLHKLTLPSEINNRLAGLIRVE